MKKSDFAKMIADKAGSSQKDAEKFLDAFMEATMETLKSGEEVALLGFGSFSVGERAERVGKNFKTGEAITVPACKIVKFKAGKNLKASVN